VTATGASISKRYDIEEIASLIGKFEFTYDEPTDTCKKPRNRPNSYNKSNLRLAKRFADLGVQTKAELPLHSGNLGDNNIKSIYNSLNQNGIHELLLMRIFPVGRGMNDYESLWNLSRDDYLRAIDKFKSLESSLKSPKVKLQCALKHLDNNNKENPCDLMHTSFGINAQGLLLSSIWATNYKGEPLDNIFVLGNISENTLDEILQAEEAKSYYRRLDENFGHCKIFAFMFSKHKDFDSLFAESDPLYA